MSYRLLIVFLLGFSSGLPLSLVTSTLQAWFADAGLSIKTIGWLSVLGLPYVCRFAWGPFLDRYTLNRLGKRRSWIITTQFLLGVGFNLMAYLNPIAAIKPLALLTVLMSFLSATQDMAIEAHRTEYLPTQEHGIGASLAVFGYRLALLCSGGVALILAEHLGWENVYHLMGFLMFMSMLAPWFSLEPSPSTSSPPNSLAASFSESIYNLLRRKNSLLLLFFILFYKLGEAFTTSISGIMMPFLIQGLGFSLVTIGYVNKIAGTVSIIAGGLFAGILLLRFSLYWSLLVFGLAQALTNGLFVMLAIVGKQTSLLVLAVVFDNFVAGLGSTALVALFMHVVDKRYTATQFSLLVALSTLPRIFSGPIAAWFQSLFGWVGLYELSVILALGFIPFLRCIKDFMPKHSCFSHDKHPTNNECHANTAQ